MSKISFTISVPHEGPHIPQLSISCNNATYLSFKGTDIASARFSNGNVVPKKGWKRLEFGVTGSRAATRFSVMVNTSAVLPPIAWSTPGPAPAASAARGGSTATKKDLRHEAKLLKEKEEGGSKGGRLRIEDGKSQRTLDERRGRSRADRGERVRRSDRREAKNVEILEDPFVTDEEQRYEDRRERVRRRDRRRSHNSERPDDSWAKESKQRKPSSQYRRRDDQIDRGESGDLNGGRKVAGKKISTRYGRSGRDSDASSQLSSGCFEDGKFRGREEKPQYRRSQRRQEPLRPVDFGFEPPVGE